MTSYLKQYRRTRIPGPVSGQSIGFTPTDLSGLVLWLDAPSIGGTDGDAVTTWADRSASANNATQSTAAAKPTFKTAIQNGLAIVRFDGGDSLVLGTNITGGPIHAFAVLDANGSGYRTIFAALAAAQLQWRIDADGKQSLLKSSTAGIGTSTSAIGANFNYIAVSYSNPNALFRLNGADDGGGTSAQTGMVINRIGINQATEQFNGDIGELLIYSSVLSDTDRNRVEGYLKTRWGL